MRRRKGQRLRATVRRDHRETRQWTMRRMRGRPARRRGLLMALKDPKAYKKYQSTYWHREKVKLRAQARLRYFKAKKITDLLKNRPCIDCHGWFEPCQMDWDHVRGIKLFEIGKISARINRKELLEEIKKCELVCANCHRLRTFKRGQYAWARKDTEN